LPSIPPHPLIGHIAARNRLSQAIRSGKLPQVLLVTGPVGVGKQRMALWLAQLARCEQPGREPCGECRSCRLVLTLSHPDVHWYVPIPRPKASDVDKLVEEAAQAIAHLISERRSEPLYQPADGMATHSLASVRLLQRQAALTAVEGGRRVFILAEADRLIAQESSQEAANALLKLLEEPPAESLFILTTVEPRRLLPTIRSRAVQIRLGRLSDSEVSTFLKTHMRPPVSSRDLDHRVALAEGSIGSALASGEETTKARTAATQWIEAVLAGPGPAFERALKQTTWAARGEFTAMLDALADTLGDAARETLGQNVRRSVPKALLRYREPAPLLEALERVADAREAAWGNVNPQVLLAVLGEELAEVL
jgi:DNA polymerase III subunit delta'